VDALGLAAALARPWADVVLSGAATPEQLRSNRAALAIPWDDRAGELAASLAENPEDDWSTRARLPWN
jgi:aryl-alcohol dehydrogenase-like predicted oxidoreductase